MFHVKCPAVEMCCTIKPASPSSPEVKSCTPAIRPVQTFFFFSSPINKPSHRLMIFNLQTLKHLHRNIKMDFTDPSVGIHFNYSSSRKEYANYTGKLTMTCYTKYSFRYTWLIFLADLFDLSLSSTFHPSTHFNFLFIIFFIRQSSRFYGTSCLIHSTSILLFIPPPSCPFFLPSTYHLLTFTFKSNTFNSTFPFPSRVLRVNMQSVNVPAPACTSSSRLCQLGRAEAVATRTPRRKVILD